jgi:peptide/nickel transport system substrate-binding protein
MARISRRKFLIGAGAAVGAAGALRGAPFVHAQKRGGTIRIIPIADLKVLDPIWTTAYVTRDHAYLIYDTLFAGDASLQIKPQMVDRYTVSRDTRCRTSRGASTRSRRRTGRTFAAC